MNPPSTKSGWTQRPKVGVVVGCGGIKAFAAVALFDFLQNEGIKLDLLVGCSGGSLMCACLAAGYTPQEIRNLMGELLDRKLFSQVNYRSLLGIANAHLGRFDQTSGVWKPDRGKRIYQRLFKDLRLEDLRPKTVLQATDIETGEGVILSRGSVRDAVYASSAFFPVFPPIEIAGRWLGDGVYSAPVPVMEAIKRNMDVIITVDFEERSTAAPQGFFECFERHVINTTRSLARSQMFLGIGLHHHEIIPVHVQFDRTINLHKVKELPTILEAGEQAVASAKTAILSAIRSFPEARRADKLS